MRRKKEIAVLAVLERAIAEAPRGRGSDAYILGYLIGALVDPFDQERLMLLLADKREDALEVRPLHSQDELDAGIAKRAAVLEVRCAVCRARAQAAVVRAELAGVAVAEWLRMPPGWWALEECRPIHVRCPTCL
jgi:hypothetical protein